MMKIYDKMKVPEVSLETLLKALCQIVILDIGKKKTVHVSLSNDNAINAIHFHEPNCIVVNLCTIPLCASCNCSCIKAIRCHKLNKCNFIHIFLFFSHYFMPAKFRHLYHVEYIILKANILLSALLACD